MHWGVVFSQKTASAIPLGVITRALSGYASISKWRFRNQPEALAGVKEFIERRTELDRQAAVHRLELIAENDPSTIAQSLDVPCTRCQACSIQSSPGIRPGGGCNKNCPKLKEFKIIRSADHTVLSTGSKQAADIIVDWITAEQKRDGKRC
jgi:hypothetical protein